MTGRAPLGRALPCPPLRDAIVGRTAAWGHCANELIGTMFHFVQQETSGNSTRESIHAAVQPIACTQIKLLLETSMLARSIWCAGSCKSQTRCQVSGQVAGGRGSGRRRLRAWSGAQVQPGFSPQCERGQEKRGLTWPALCARMQPEAPTEKRVSVISRTHATKLWFLLKM